MQLDDEVPLSGETRVAACGTDGCPNSGVTFDVPVELSAICGPCGAPLTDT